MPTMRNRLRRAKPKHMVISIVVGLLFALSAVWIHEHRYFTMPVFAVLTTVLATGAAFLAPLLVTLRLSPKKEDSNDRS